VDGPAATSGAPIGAPVELGRELIDAAALGEIVIMATMMAEYDVTSPERPADADRDGFLPGPEMSRRPHLLLAIALRKDFFGQSHAQKIMV